MNFVFAGARFPSEFGFLAKTVRCKVASVDKISAWSATWGEVVVTLVKEMGMPDARSI